MKILQEHCRGEQCSPVITWVLRATIGRPYKKINVFSQPLEQLKTAVREYFHNFDEAEFLAKVPYEEIRM